MRRVAYTSSSAVHLPLRSSTGAVGGAPGAALVGWASIVGHVFPWNLVLIMSGAIFLARHSAIE
jgi:hypothetical protein